MTDPIRVALHSRTDGNPLIDQLRGNLLRHLETRYLPEACALLHQVRGGSPLTATDRESIESMLRDLDRAGRALGDDADWARAQRSAGELADLVLTEAAALDTQVGKTGPRGERSWRE